MVGRIDMAVIYSKEFMNYADIKCIGIYIQSVLGKRKSCMDADDSGILEDLCGSRDLFLRKGH